MMRLRSRSNDGTPSEPGAPSATVARAPSPSSADSPIPPMGRHRWLAGWARDSSILVVSQGMLTATATVVLVLLSHGLSRSQFGTFASLLGLSQALSFIVDVGLPTWLLREGAQDYAAPAVPAIRRRIFDRLWHSVYSVSVTGGGVALVVTGAAVALHLSIGLAVAEGVFVLYVGTLAASSALESDFRARRRPSMVVFATMLEKSTILIGVVIVLTSHLGVLGVAGATLAGGAVRLSYGFYRTLFRKGIERPPFRRDSFAVLARSAPFAANTAALAFFPRMDTPVVALFSIGAASYFTLGFQVTTTAMILPGIAASTLYPFLQSRDSGERRRVFVWVMALGGVVVAGMGIALSPLVVPLLFGDRYRPAVTAVQVMWLAVPFAFVVSALTTVLYSRGREHAVVRAIWLPSILGTGCVVSGVALDGAVGAGAGYAARLVLQTCVISLVVRRTSSTGAGLRAT